MAVIGINYSGGNTYDDQDNLIENPIKYKGVYIHLTDGTELNFKTKDFVKDWYDAKKKFINELSDTEPYLGASSSVNHFIMDGAKFDSAYLHITEGDKPILKYIDRTDEKWYLTDIDSGIEFFVKEGTTPTWEELRELCGDPKLEKEIKGE
jgi:hypothetical protein